MWQAIASYVDRGANSGKPNSGIGGASGYGLANTASVDSKSEASAFTKSPFDVSNWTVATGGSRASPVNTQTTNDGVQSMPNEYLLIAGAILVVMLWKKL